ncbi:MAG: YdbL family protein [Cardiobacterium sp.]|uniref:YdbL family protein n=1 Tax=uncultured Cardiobacterium sp. TaxID=417619 RepID=UPI00261883BB|nr:YdbL family protein [uncultured Cardiobacterium sp.]
MYKRSLALLAPIAVVSCVTVNIYFPAAAAEKAADQIILDVWHQQGGAAEATKAATTPPAAKNSGAKNEHSALDPRRIVVAALSAISGEAHAQNVDFNASSPQIEQIKARMASRFGELRPFLDSGAVGLTGDGLVAVHDANAASMAERARMNQLVNAENKDRKALYQAIADANNQPGWAGQIQKTFAERWISQAQSGWWYQSGGSWKQK